MLVAQLSTGDLAILSVATVVAAVLLYRIFRGEPRTRIARFGVFIERELLGIDEEDEQPSSEQDTEIIERKWPRDER